MAVWNPEVWLSVLRVGAKSGQLNYVEKTHVDNDNVNFGALKSTTQNQFHLPQIFMSVRGIRPSSPSPSTVLLRGPLKPTKYSMSRSAELQHFGGFEGILRMKLLLPLMWCCMEPFLVNCHCQVRGGVKPQHLLVITCMFCFYSWR